MRFIIVFIVLITNYASAKTIILKEANLDYSQKMQFYFSEDVFKSFIDPHMKNLFIMNVENASSVRDELDKISSFKDKNINYRFPKNVKYLDISP